MGFTLWWTYKKPQKAIENGHRNSGFSHKKCWFSIAMLVYQRGVSLRAQPGPSHCTAQAMPSSTVAPWQPPEPPHSCGFGTWHRRGGIRFECECQLVVSKSCIMIVYTLYIRMIYVLHRLDVNPVSKWFIITMCQRTSGPSIIIPKPEISLLGGDGFSY